ncbi:MAG TPA: cytochrome c [Chthoniobacteraceae bacterium]|jgi:cytochrome c553|nr:cytochrome c [Chthoniobacteraceae bacterium]
MNRFVDLCRRIAGPGLAAASLLLAGCDQLAHGSKIAPLQPSDFFADGQSSRVPPMHSIPLSGLRTDSLLYAGRNPDGTVSSQFPWPVNANVLARGQQQYLAICANCHGPDGYGDGIVVRRGFPHPPSYYEERLLKAPAGHFFQVITHGYGAMYPYASIVDVNDRWAIVAYIRALQRSQHATAADVPPDALASLQKEAK